MKITMVGTTGSGKTAYMAALHEALALGHSSGFRMVPETSDLESQIFAIGRWESITFPANNYNWPPGTVQTTDWQFSLKYQTHHVASFDWIDYRGGILTDLSRGQATGEVKEILYHVIMSNAVILLADSFLLTHYSNPALAARKSGAHIINAIFQAFSDAYPQRDLIFVIMLTKCDAVDDTWKDNGTYRPLVNRALEVFAPMVSLCRLNPTWIGGIAPVSAVGEGKVIRTVTDQGDIHTTPTTEDKFVDHPSPLNAENVLFYCLGTILAQMQDFRFKPVARQECAGRVVPPVRTHTVNHTSWHTKFCQVRQL